MKQNLTPTEEQECMTFVAYMELKGLKYSHLAQSTFTKSFSVLNRNKRMGVVRGVPDYIVITQNGLVFVEMKRVKGSVTSPAQKEWIAALNECVGVEAKVCAGAEAAIKFVEEFL